MIWDASPVLTLTRVDAVAMVSAVTGTFPPHTSSILGAFSTGWLGCIHLKKANHNCTIYTDLSRNAVINFLKYNEAVIIIHNFWILRSHPHLGRRWSATSRHTFLSGYHCRDRNTPSQASWGTSSSYRHRNTHCGAGGENICRINKFWIHSVIYMHILYELISNAIS